MKKVWINYWVDLVTGVSFLLCAITGVVFLFFPGLVSVSGGEATILGVSAVAWHWVHDWSGAVMTAGVGLHFALHLRWLVNMTRKLGGRTGGRREGAAGRSRRRAPAAAPATPAAAADVGARAGTPALAAGVDSRAYPEASLERLRRLDGRPRGANRYSRKAFLTGAAAAGGAALLGGWALVRDTSTSALPRSSDGWGEGGSEYSEDSVGYGQSDSSSSGDSPTGSSGGSSTGSSGTGSNAVDRVAVSAACVGCGRCVPACPDGVFGWSDDGRVTAADPASCRLCGRCLQVCPASAITLNG